MYKFLVIYIYNIFVIHICYVKKLSNPFYQLPDWSVMKITLLFVVLCYSQSNQTLKSFRIDWNNLKKRKKKRSFNGWLAWQWLEADRGPDGWVGMCRETSSDTVCVTFCRSNHLPGQRNWFPRGWVQVNNAGLERMFVQPWSLADIDRVCVFVSSQ